MRRAPFVIGGTAAGLALVLSFHTSSPSLAGSAGAPPTTAPRSTTTTAPTAAPRSTTTTAPATRSATSQQVFYRYGVLELKVTVSDNRIKSITAVEDQATDPRSAEINGQAVPMLHDEAMQAQSANIDGVSGATYTSEAYVQSLQAALDRLGHQG